jgi:hypothetical protein
VRPAQSRAGASRGRGRGQGTKTQGRVYHPDQEAIKALANVVAGMIAINT